MKKLYRNIIVLIAAICFSVAGFTGENASAQTKIKVKSTPTPKSKKSPTTTVKETPKPTPKPKATKPAVKSTTPVKTTKSTTKTATNNKTTNSNTKASTTPKPTPKPTQKPAVIGQVIITSTASRIRQQPKTNSAQLSTVKLGKTLPVSEKTEAWYRVQYAEGKSGWISKTIAKDFDTDKRDEIYREIIDKYSGKKTLDFATASELAEFLKIAQVMVKTDKLKADLGIKRLRFLSAALKAIPFGKGEQPPYKTFIKGHEKEVVYSDPSAQWYVRSDAFWELHNKFTALPVAEEIAWEAAQNPIPGECEGYVNCYLYLLRATDAEYLNFYPNGKYSKKALSNITNMLEPMVADINGKSVYTPPTDISDRAEFNRFLTELRTIISKMPDVEKAKTLQQINLLGEGYK
jgi:hypothetical protein